MGVVGGMGGVGELGDLGGLDKQARGDCRSSPPHRYHALRYFRLFQSLLNLYFFVGFDQVALADIVVSLNGESAIVA